MCVDNFVTCRLLLLLMMMRMMQLGFLPRHDWSTWLGPSPAAGHDLCERLRVSTAHRTATRSASESSAALKLAL